MPLTDMSRVTETLRGLLELNINSRIAPELTTDATVNTLPPERVEGGANVLNLYCYHVSEDPHNRFRPQQAVNRPIATSPLTLVLHYILTAHTQMNTMFDALGEQQLLGYAMKTFHDFPVLDDTVMIGTDRILPDSLQGRDNRFEITMVQMSSTDALNFWANEDQTTAKPSAYYEVRPVEIMSDPASRVPGIVLSLGAFVTIKDTPTIGSTEGDLHYTLPVALGAAAMSLQTSPAKVGPIAAAPPPVTNILRLKGSALSKGARQTLMLSHPHWAILFPDLPRIPVDTAMNAPDWSVQLTEEGVTIEISEELQFTLPDGTTPTVTLYPGSYLASWMVTEVFDRPEGPRLIDQRSNDAAFTVNPRIVALARNAATGEVTLTFGGAWLLNRGRPPAPDAVAEPELEIMAAVDGDAYRLVTAADPVDPGTFVIGAHDLTYRPLPAADTAGVHAVQVVVEGAESQPFWIEIP